MKAEKLVVPQSRSIDLLGSTPNIFQLVSDFIYFGDYHLPESYHPDLPLQHALVFSYAVKFEMRLLCMLTIAKITDQVIESVKINNGDFSNDNNRFPDLVVSGHGLAPALEVIYRDSNDKVRENSGMQILMYEIWQRLPSLPQDAYGPLNSLWENYPQSERDMYNKSTSTLAGRKFCRNCLHSTPEWVYCGNEKCGIIVNQDGTGAVHSWNQKCKDCNSELFRWACSYCKHCRI